MDKWTRCDDQLPKPGKYWITIGGYTRSLGESEPTYKRIVVTDWYMEDRWMEVSSGMDYGQSIIAWQPFITPQPYVDTSRHTCKLCCGSKILQNDKPCWRCGGRGDEAVDGSDVVHKMTQELRKEYGLGCLS